MNEKTAECLAEIRRAAAAGEQMIAPVTFSHCYGRGAASAAFRIALKEKVIVVAYKSIVGTNVYKGA